MVCLGLPLSPACVVCSSPLPLVACQSSLLLPGASEVVSDSNCIISPWKAQLNPELMMMVEVGTLSQLGPPGERGGREDGREEEEGWRGCWEQPCTIAASRNSVWVVGGGRVGPGHTGALRLRSSFFLKESFFFNTQPCAHPHTHPNVHTHTPSCPT